MSSSAFFDFLILHTQKKVKMMMMISSRKLIKLARKWQKLVSPGRKTISWTHDASTKNPNSCSASSTASKGHFVVYSTDRRRFEIPLSYLRDQVFAELLQAAEEEFGLPRNGPITLPCDGVLLEYTLSLIRRSASYVHGCWSMLMRSRVGV